MIQNETISKHREFNLKYLYITKWFIPIHRKKNERKPTTLCVLEYEQGTKRWKNEGKIHLRLIYGLKYQADNTSENDVGQCDSVILWLRSSKYIL